MISCIIVDDDLVSLNLVKHFVTNTDGLNLLQAFTDSVEAANYIRKNSATIDLIFLDVEMPNLTGIEMLASIKEFPPVILISSKEKYAIQAFERAAVDYLLKPVARARLAVTLARLAAGATDRVATLPKLTVPVPQYLPVRMNYSVRMVAIAEIVAATAREKRVDILTSDTVYSTYYTLNQLEQRLPADRFVRVHGGWIVNLAEVQEIHNLGSQSYQLRLRSKDHLVPVSRRRLPLLQERLGI